MVIIKIGLIFALIVLLLRLKIPFSAAILISGLMLGIGFNLELFGIGRSALKTVISPETLSLAAIVGIILMLSELLQASDQLTALSRLIIDTFGMHRYTYTILPALIGLLPMPGGALFSAPLLDNVGNEYVPAHKKTLINYWFRHIWEYFWPLYPGLVLAAGLFKIDLYTLALFQSPMTVVSIVAGIIFIFPHIQTPPSINNQKTPIKEFFRLIYLVLPIIIIITLFLFRLPMLICLLVGLGWVIINILAFKQLSLTAILKIMFLKKHVYQMMIIVLSILAFTGILQASTLANDLAYFFNKGSGNISMLVVLLSIVFMPFIVGLLTGMTMAFVGVTFPILFSSILPPGAPMLPYLMLAYVSGFSGVMLSPLHLCLILTNQYYGSRLGQVYRYLIPIVLTVLTSALIIFWIYTSVMHK
jgi:integral membrane protein (TIGR00529 family)